MSGLQCSDSKPTDALLVLTENGNNVQEFSLQAKRILLERITGEAQQENRHIFFKAALRLL